MTEGTSVRQELASWVLYDDSKGKHKEAGLLSLLLSRLGLDVEDIIPGESPDFMLSFRKDSIEAVVGCEVTALYSDGVDAKAGSPRKRFFEKWKRFAYELRKRLDSAGHLYVYGSLSFKDVSTPALDTCRLDSLFDELIRVCDEYTGETEHVVFPVDGYAHLNALVDHIGLHRFSETGLLWWCAHLRSGAVQDPTDALVSAIGRKKETAAGYHWGNATERWLVVVAEALLLTDIVTGIGDPEVPKTLGALPFTRVILWDRFMDEVIQVYPVFCKFCDSCQHRRNIDQYPEAIKPFVFKGRDYVTTPRGKR